MNPEVQKFTSLAQQWWEINGPLRTLHDINPVRLHFIKNYLDPKGKEILDVGCGGGILAEALSHQGGFVTGIDLGEELIEVANLHKSFYLPKDGSLNYLCTPLEELAKNEELKFDLITCMELLEHVDNPENLISNMIKLLKPDGVIFCSTINKTLRSRVLAIWAAEQLLNLTPKGTHSYAKLISPLYLSKLFQLHNFKLVTSSGISYNPFSRKAKLTKNLAVNYLAAFKFIGV